MIKLRSIVAIAAVAVLGVAADPSLAQGRGGGGHGGGGGGGHPGGGYYHGGGGHYHGGGWYHGGYYRPYYPYYWGGVALGVGVGLASSYYWGWPYYGYYYGAPAYYDYGTPANPGYTVATAPPAPAPAQAAGNPEPIYYPRNGQSDSQREADVRECNRWATTQPPAMADSSVFQRAVLACMDGRGYTGR